MPPAFLIRNGVPMVGNLIQSWCLILDIFSAPPYLANIKYVRPLYIMPSLPLSFRALWSCSPIHLEYAFLGENCVPKIHLLATSTSASGDARVRVRVSLTGI